MVTCRFGPAFIVCIVAVALPQAAGRGRAAEAERGAAAPVPPDEAAAALKLPAGFAATVFAAEPDVRQPISMSFDDRGRLWVAENYSYPNWKPPGEGEDRILIFEDADGDGRHDKRTVFYEK